jgi:hypothetical protein
MAASGNDTTASLNGGQLVFEKSRDVSMESEDLEISSKKIKVDYTFLNTSNKPIHGIVAFPIEDFEIGGHNVDMPGDFNNPLNFELFVDGKKMPFKTKYKKSEIENADMDVYSDYRIYWEQTFPPQRLIKVSHSYKPSLGSGDPDEAKICADEKFKKAIKKLMNRIDSKLHATEQEKMMGKRSDVVMFYSGFRNLHYILKTAQNWKGPIKKFHLIVDKGDPANLVSFCGSDVRKISPTRFEVYYTNFIPKEDLFVSFAKEP